MYAQTLEGFFLAKKEGTPNLMQHSHSSSVYFMATSP